MANPADPGLQETWIGLRVPFPLANPKSGNTGTQEAWIGLRVDVPAYVAVVAAAGGVPFFFLEEQLHGGMRGFTGGFQ